MRFRRAKTSHIGEQPVARQPGPAIGRGQRGALRRVLALLLVGAVVYAFLFVEESWIRAEGLIAGPSVPVEPFTKARIAEIYGTCNRKVEAGQPLVKLETEATGIAYDATLRQLVSRKVELTGAVRVAAEDVAQARNVYNGTLTVLAEKATLFGVHDKLFKDGVINKTEWDLTRIAYKEAEAGATAAEGAWRSKQAVYDRAERQVLSDVKSIDEQLEQMRKSEEIQKVQVLRAPKGGIITQCGYLPGAVVDAGSAVFVIFDPREAHIEAFFEPENAERLRVGMEATIRLPGFAQPLKLPISSIDTVITRRPEELTRYFWQREQWTQYRPVRIELRNLRPEEIERIRHGAHATVSILFLPAWIESIAKTLGVGG